MESESKAELPNWFLNSQKRKVGDMSILRRTGKIKREKHPSRRSLNILCIGYHLGSDRPERNHTQPAEIGTEVRSEELRLQLRGPCRACPLEVCGPRGHKLTQETPLRAVQPLCCVLISPACR